MDVYNEAALSDAPEDAFALQPVPVPPVELAEHAERRRTWARHAVAAAVSLGALGAFVSASRMVSSRRANALDQRILRAMRRVRSPRRNGIVRDVTSIGGAPLIGLVACAGALLARRSRSAVAQVALGAIGGVAAELLLKRHFARPRPTAVEKLQPVSSFSFPSGHAIATSCVYLTLAFVASHHAHLRRARTELLVAAGSVATAVGFSRVYLGVHYPTDVVGGLALGTAWASLLEAVFDYRGARALESRAVVPTP